MNFISIKNILAKAQRDLGFKMTEADAIEWIAEALAHIGQASTLETVVTFAKVENYRLLLPSGFQTLLQVAKNHCYEEDTSSACPAAVVADTDTIVTDDCGNILDPCDYGRYLPAYSMDAFFGWTGNVFFQTCYSPLRLSTGTFFEGIGQVPNSNNLHPENDSEYKINYPYLQFSFCDGFVAVAYTRARVDNTGLPMIPDMESFREAAIRYIRMKHYQRRVDTGDQLAMNLLVKAESDWHWYCEQAKNEAKMHKGLGEWENKLQRSLNMMPDENAFTSFFGNVNEPWRPQYKTW